MSWFLGGIAFLALGYFTYGKVVERLIPPDDRKTPCIAHPDGVDYVPLPKWKNMLIQLLNIAGVGPVIGVILGIKFGKVALLIIPVGCVFMGAVHDFFAGMISMRMNGANMPRMVREHLGAVYSRVFTWIMMLALLLCVTVFINTPSMLIDKHWLPGTDVFWWAVVAIFVYYIAATLFPVDKIIGRIYPVFGALLIVGSAAISVALVVAGLRTPEIFADCAGFAGFQSKNPLFPCLFVTIACGIVSGFHATQSPIVARTCRSEREARATFFGMMIAEGVIAMIWAAAALAIYNLNADYISLPGPVVLGHIATHFLGTWMGGVTVAAIVVLAITSGDTALRSARLSLGEEAGIDQVKVPTRVLTCLPLVAIVAALLWWSNKDKGSFGHLWNYFAWMNQLVSTTMLMAATVWLLRLGRGAKCLVTLVPGVFMCMVITTFIFWAWPSKGQVWGVIPGGLSLTAAACAGAVVTAAVVAAVLRSGLRGGGRAGADVAAK